MANILIFGVSVLLVVAGSVFFFKKNSTYSKTGRWINVCFDDLKSRESGKR